jgi:hypothetical protein
MTKQILLGHKACDVITGFEGIATTLIEFMTGNRQLSLQPRMKEDGTMPLPQSLDISVLEYVGEGEVARRVEPEDTSHIVLGSAAQDIVTKVEGILLHRYTFLNGCVYFSIQPAIKNKDDREIFVEWKRYSHYQRAYCTTYDDYQPARWPVGIFLRPEVGYAVS